MNAKELNGYVVLWPEGARDDGLEWDDELDSWIAPAEAAFVSVDHAVAIFVASGLEWLTKYEWRGLGRGHLLMDQVDDGDFAIDWHFIKLDGITETYLVCDLHASTIFLAIHAAIIATQGEKQ